MSPRPSTTSASRVTLLVGLLAATVVVASLLAYEAHDASRSERVTVERALRDYASVAAWELEAASRKRMETALVRALGPVTTGQASSPYETLLPVSVLATTASSVLPCPGEGDSTRTYLRLDLRDGSFAMSGAPIGDAEAARTVSAMRAYAQSSAPTEQPYGVVALAPGQWVAVGVKYAQHGAPLAVFAFTVCEQALGAPFLAAVMRDHPLLPASVRGVMPDDSLLAVEVRDARGAIVFARSASVRSPYAASVALAAVPGWRATVAVRPQAASAVMVSRPAGSRVPVLIALLGLTATLATLALLQLRREQELARLRADFTSSVSHELRTPLAQILLFGETLSYGRARTEAERDFAAETIVQEARRLMQMVENILRFSGRKREGLAANVTRVPLAALVRDVVRGFAPLAARSGMTIAVSAPDHSDVVVRAEEAAVRQILLNLLDNAVKYGPAGQCVRVEVSRSGGRWGTLAVSDEGPGVEPQDHDRIWEPYVRLRTAGSGGGGAGLGLSVVRELAESLGGRARVEAGAGNGSRGARFVVELEAVDGDVVFPADAGASNQALAVPDARGAPPKSEDTVAAVSERHHGNAPRTISSRTPVRP